MPNSLPDIQADIKKLLMSYEFALNTSDVDAAIELYAEDCVFMPQYESPSVGKLPVRQSYVAILSAIKLNIKFNIEEIAAISPEWAYARTTSSGTISIVASGDTFPAAFQEFFLLRKAAGRHWAIARYCFNSTKSPTGE